MEFVNLADNFTNLESPLPPSCHSCPDYIEISVQSNREIVGDYVEK